MGVSGFGFRNVSGRASNEVAFETFDMGEGFREAEFSISDGGKIKHYQYLLFVETFGLGGFRAVQVPVRRRTISVIRVNIIIPLVSSTCLLVYQATAWANISS